jgi:hypothetical protein
MIGARKSERKDMEKQAWTIGESVVVKPGVSDPDTGRDIGGWQGRISDLFEEEGTVMIHWDRLTLERMPLAHIAWCEEESLDWSAMTLAAEEVVPATARDTEEEVVQARRTIESQTNWLYLGGEQGQRVQALVNQAEDKDNDYSVMQTWHTHLTKHLTCPFTATVTEEQRGPIRQGDQVTVLQISDLDNLYGTLVEVRSIHRTAAFPLCDLKATQADLSTQQLVDDYSIWFANR